MDLYRAVIEVEVVVYAEDEADAQDLVSMYADDALDDCIPMHPPVSVVACIDDIDKSWTNSLPFVRGIGEEEETVAQILKKKG